MKIEFTKMSGAGNDFVLVDNRSNLISDRSATARAICDRRWGVGADGLLLIERSEKASYKMMYYNADGSYGGMCGNGGRCVARYAVLQRIAPQEHAFEALDHIYDVSLHNDNIRLSMKDPADFRLNLKLSVLRRRITCHFVDTGSPHVVVPVQSLPRSRGGLSSVNVPVLGKLIRFHKAFTPNGTNVNFIELIDGTSLKIRTYERGVEAETLACGTGAIASAVVGALIWDLKPPVKIVPASSVPLSVDFIVRGKHVEKVTLTGPATVVFTGAMHV
ncbi:MAG: diaminopimelate epimerase [Bacteroidota bacterium]